jgi:spore maturation protein CgeB
MLYEYSDDLNNIFKEGIEAEYFINKEEMIDKIKFYLSNDEKRIRIANNGYKKLRKGKHEVIGVRLH